VATEITEGAASITLIVRTISAAQISGRIRDLTNVGAWVAHLDAEVIRTTTITGGSSQSHSKKTSRRTSTNHSSRDSKNTTITTRITNISLITNSGTDRTISMATKIIS